MTNAIPTLYRDAILREAPRVLGLMDRDPWSKTAGSCDRTYWAWKFVDYQGSRFQEALCVLAYLWSHPFPGNVYHGNEAVLAWIALGFERWAALQYRDGSFDEAYPFERSLAATAFTGFYVGEAYHWVQEHLPTATRSRTRDTLHRAGLWLTRNDESHGFLSNHLAAAAAALLQAERLDGHAPFAIRRQHFLDKILSHQSAEGWYDEYGGADPGYQTHGTFYLARIWQATRDETLLASLRRALPFQAIFCHVDGSLGGEYTSRNTQTYYPAAFEMLRGVDGVAAWIAETMRPSVEDQRAAGLRGVDAYNYFPLLNNHVFADLAVHDGEPALAPVEPHADETFVHFEQAGLARIRRARYDAYVGTRKGAVLKVLDRRERRLVFADCGFIGRTRKGRLVSSQKQGGAREVRVAADGIDVEATFHAVSRPTMTPWRFVAFRVFMLTIGRFPTLARWVKKQLVRILITRNPGFALTLRRSIAFDDDGLVLCDHLEGKDGAKLTTLERGERFTTIHMGSSRYFVAHELLEHPGTFSNEGNLATRDLSRGVDLERRLTLNDRSS